MPGTRAQSILQLDLGQVISQLPLVGPLTCFLAPTHGTSAAVAPETWAATPMARTSATTSIFHKVSFFIWSPPDGFNLTFGICIVVDRAKGTLIYVKGWPHPHMDGLRALCLRAHTLATAAPSLKNMTRADKRPASKPAHWRSAAPRPLDMHQCSIAQST